MSESLWLSTFRKRVVPFQLRGNCNEHSNKQAHLLKLSISSGSSGRVGGAEKHEIYVAAFGGHLFYDLFSQGQGGAMAPSAPPLDPLLSITVG